MSVFLDQSALTNANLAGGKAASLARLARLAPIPPFFVIAPQDGALSPQARQDIVDRARALGGHIFAVRSSAMQEDGPRLAHAGQFLSVLGVAAEDVPEAAARVFASAAQADAYRQAKGVAGSTEMAVIVQCQLTPDAAGAAFSADPVTGQRGRITIAAVRGLADALMSGAEDGETYVLDRAGHTLETQGSGAPPVLDIADRARVAALAIACEDAAGCPQDIEWAIEGGELHLLQSRPITTLPPIIQIADDALSIWDNSNIVESYPGIVSPLTFSFARHIYAHAYRGLLRLLSVPASTVSAHDPVLENLLGRIDGRVYYNLLNWYRTLALLPGFSLNRRAMEEMMGVGAALPDSIAETLAPPRPRGMRRLGVQAQLGLVLLRLAGSALFLPRRIAAFQTRLAVALAPPDPPLAARPLTALAAEYRRLEGLLLRRWDAPLVNDLVCMIAFSLSRRALGAWAGQAGLALHAEVMVGQGDIVSAEPARLILAMGELARDQPGLVATLGAGRLPDPDAAPALRASIAAYVEKFGDRCAEELKLESTPLQDDPSPLLRAIAAAATATPRALRESADPKTTLNALFAGRSFKRRAAAFLLGWARARVRDRENLRLERTRLFGRVRSLLRAMGAQLAATGVLRRPRDVFQLTIEEVLGAIEGGGVSLGLQDIADLRSREQARFETLADLPERIEYRGAAASGLRAVAAASPAAPGADMQRTGLGCAPGSVQGTACVVRDARTASLAPGEILVARHTDPGWIALFTNAAAIVTERGSLLSHSAIIARELGIPCVVQCKGATAWIAHGDTIAIDGTTGTVTILERAAHD